MLVGGYVGDIGGDDQSVIDIIDVEDASFSCSRTRNFNPIVSNENMIGAGGGTVLFYNYGYTEVPFICGGADQYARLRSQCWRLRLEYVLVLHI